VAERPEDGVPFLSWFEGDVLHRHALASDCQVGRDPILCPVSRPQDPTVSRVHAEVCRRDGRWCLRDLDSHNGVRVAGVDLDRGGQVELVDGQEIRLGDWVLTYTEGFPGLDGINFLEGVADLFAEPPSSDSEAARYREALGLLHRSSASLLEEGSSNAMFRRILTEALGLLAADRGFVVMVDPSGGWRSLHRVGDLDDRQGLSHSVVDYVLEQHTAVLSNAPLIDPRFGGASLVELHRGAVMCAPLEVDRTIQGVLYLDRCQEGRPFTRFDLILLQTFTRQGALGLRHIQLAQKAMGQADAQGEFLRLKGRYERILTRAGELLGSMGSCLRWIQSYAESGYGDRAAVLKHQAERLEYLVEAGLQETLLEVPLETPVSTSLAMLQASVEPCWRDLLRIRNITLELDKVPRGTIWAAGHLAVQAVQGLVEPLLMQVPEGAQVRGEWQEQTSNWTLRLQFPAGIPIPTPDPWTFHTLQDVGIVWRWNDQNLSLAFAKMVDHAPEAPQRPLLGLVTEEFELMWLFESVAAAGDMAILPLEMEPPRLPVPPMRYLVIDAKGTDDVLSCTSAYRRHPAFATVPILVVRAPDDLYPQLLAAGATDCLPDRFRWETLHHRLQVLKGHEELQRKARAAERLDSLRQMAGTLKHEINNPLAVISMQVELLIRKYPDEPKLAKVMEMVERIRVLVQVLQKMRESTQEEYPGGDSILKLT
jgi:GAF domain-containing protein